MGREAIPHGEIVVDDRGRTCLARIRREQHGRYKAAERQDGTIVLTPVLTGGLARRASEIDVDGRGRTSLAPVRDREFARYAADERATGTIVLTPVITVHPADLADLEAARVTAEQLLARRARVRYHAELARR